MNTRVAMTLAVVAGCTWGGPPAPIVVGVEPASITSVTSGVGAVLSVTVTGLDGVGSVDFDDPERGEVCDYFRVELSAASGVALPLHDVVRVSATVIRGVLDGADHEADPDTFDVVVRSPDGRAGRLAGGFELAKCGSPGQTCDDGNDCTGPEPSPDTCHDANRCDPGVLVADGTPCTPPCPWGTVTGLCDQGVCVPEPGACAPAPAPCTSP